MAAKKKSKWSAARPSLFSLEGVPWARLASVGLGLLGVGAVVGGIGLADRRAGTVLSESAPTIRFTWAPTSDESGTWPPPDVQLELDRQANEIAARSGGPLSIDLLERLGTWIVGTGWVHELRGVRRTDPGVITVEAAWRIPAGVVRQNGYDYLVSTEGRRLAKQWPQNSTSLPVIAGAQSASAVTSVLPGERWPDRNVHAGVELLTTLHRALGVDPILGPRGFDQVWGVDVSEFEARQRLVIITDQGNRIIWGRAPSDPVSDIVPTHQKLKNLEYMRRHPDYGRRIDAAQRLIDLSAGPILVDDRPARPDNPDR